MSIKTYFQYLFHEIIDNVGMKQQRQQKQTLRDKKARLLVGPVNLFKNIPINYQKLRVKVVFLVYSEKFQEISALPWSVWFSRYQSISHQMSVITILRGL